MGALFFAAWRLVLKRSASDLLIIAAAFVTVLLAAMLLAAGPIYANAVALSGLERTLADAPALFAFYEGLAEHATLVAGSWPDASGSLDAAVSRPAAGALGLEPGDS